jgi:hypothetical protein
MVRTAAQPKTRAQVSRTTSVPSPIGGWNARDSIANMDEKDAVILQNFFATTSSVQLRQGSTNWATGLGNQVNSLMAYNPSLGTPKMFASAGGSTFDVTASGPVGAPVLTAKTNDKWQNINFANSAGSWLLMVNGADSGQKYDGTTWSNMVLSGGANSANMIHIAPYANRVWMLEKQSLKAWYLAVGAVEGAATAFDLTPVFSRGSYLVALGVWTVDAGDSSGMTDYLCFVTNQGEVAIYMGTDPSSATTFSKKGVWRLGAPMSTRCLMKFGGDLIFIGKDGLAPFTKALASSRVNTQVNLTGKIDGAINVATSIYAGTFGWQTLLFPGNNMLFLNIPVSIGNQEQYVMNTITGAWSRFTGWAANCWELFNEQPYYGGNGVVVKAWDGSYDDNGSSIIGEALQAFSYFGTSQLKQFLMARPIIQTNGAPGVQMGFNVDYDLQPPVGVPGFSQPVYGLWDSGLWDNAIWGTDAIVRKDWQYISGVGYTGALHFRIGALDASCNWVSTDFLMRDGGVL